MDKKSLKLSMIILVQNDLEKALAFYTRLGLKTNFHIENQWAELDLNGIKLGLLPVKEEKLEKRQVGFVLEVDDIKAWVELLKSEGVECADPVEKTHGIMSNFVDPGNNVIDIYQPTPEKLKAAMEAAQKEDKS